MAACRLRSIAGCIGVALTLALSFSHAGLCASEPLPTPAPADEPPSAGPTAPQASKPAKRKLPKVVLKKGKTPDTPAARLPGVTPLEAMRQAREIMSQPKEVTRRFNDLLVVASPLFEEVKILPPDDPVRWQKVTLNTHGTQFDGVKFRSPLATRGNLVWSFVFPAAAPVDAWYIKPEEWRMLGFRTWHKVENLYQPGLPERNTVVLQQLTHFEIQPEMEYFLYFRFNHDAPVEMHIKLKVLPESGEPIFDRPYDLAQTLDFDLPFRFTQAVRLFPE